MMKPMHGLEENRRISVKAGRVVYQKREKYCDVHGWIDLLIVGGAEGWKREHGSCVRFTLAVLCRQLENLDASIGEYSRKLRELDAVAGLLDNARNERRIVAARIKEITALPPYQIH